MCNYSSCCKRIGFTFILILLMCLPFSVSKIAYATDESLQEELNQNIDKVLSDIDFSGLDQDAAMVPNLNLSFGDLVKEILNGNYSSDYGSIFEYVKDIFLDNFYTYLRFFISLFVIVVLFEILRTFSDNRLKEMKNAFKLIFSFLIATTILLVVKDLFSNIKDIVEGLFSFASILFPILIGLLTLSGSVKSATVFSSFSVFLLETGAFILRYVLLPISLSILLLSLFSSIFSKGQFSKLNNLFKSAFKYIFIIFFSIFGLLSTVNVITSSTHDGINLKLTKYALKNYIPILGGYVSEGFDFIFSCSVLVKNAIGVCSLIVLLFKVLMPVIIIIFFSFGFKVLSALTALIGDGGFAQMFDDVSNSFGNFLSVIIGSFLIVFVFVFLVILSVGVA